MIAPPTITPGRIATACLLALASCHGDRDPTSGPSSTDATTGTATSLGDVPVAESSGGSPGSACADDYHGNQAHETALDLALDTTDTAIITLGDGWVATPAEVGDDALAVCDAYPSDFFAFMAQCPGYLSIEARTLEGRVPELLLYEDESISPGVPPLEQALGAWYGFFLKPLQRGLEDGVYVIEVRHGGGGPQRYSLTVTWLPESPCPP